MPMKKKIIQFHWYYYCSLCDNHNIVAEISAGQRSNYYFHI